MAVVRTFHRIPNRQKQITEESVGSAETGGAIYLHGDTASLAVHPSGTAKAQFTLSSEERIEAGTARWFDWFKGNVTAPAADIPEGPIMAVRLVSITGAAVIEVIR